MPLPYALIRPLLFSLDPEVAHGVTLRTLHLLHQAGLSRLYAQPRVQDPMQLMGLRFPNRIGLAAGLDKNGEAIDALAALGFGFIEVGTVTPRAQSGNPKPRMFRLPQAQALINRMGFNNAGLDAFLRHVRRSRRELPLGLNIGKNASTPIAQALDDYVTGLRAVYAHADYVTLNVSSPNTQGLRALQTETALESLLSGMAAEREQLTQVHDKRVPLVVKVAPDLLPEQIAALADALMRHGIDGVIATNTTIARDAVAGLPHADEAGGLSGPPVRDASNRVIAQLRARLGASYPIIGVGGILHADDAVAKIQSGADAVQLYTGLIYQGPALVARCAAALAQMHKAA
jgi:dihydroorotate dehydrogenase